ncbi:MAG: type IV pilus assembly protein PilM [Candidatus Sungbacteria bacterium]|nr:type IV pilus assembly protein PilM [Candidatus Sungbacteria bacterium]
MKDLILRTIDPFLRRVNIGLDISEHSAKYLAFTRKKPFAVDISGEIEIPEGIIEQAEIKKEEELAAIFRAWRLVLPRHLQSAEITVSLPEEKSFVRVIQLPQIEKDKVAQAVRWELEANVPIPQDQLIYDYEVIEPLENHINHVDVAITAFPKSIIEPYVRVLKIAGFTVAALELESQAIIRACIPELRTRHACIVIDMGRNRTSFIIFSGGAIRFTTTIPLGGKTLEENIMKALGVKQEEALEIKKTVGLDKKALEGKVFAALVPAMSAFADELHRAVFFYQDHATHTHGAEPFISSLFLSGGDANLLGLATYLGSSLQIPVNTVNPFATAHRFMATTTPPLPPQLALAFTTAIGLALRDAS